MHTHRCPAVAYSGERCVLGRDHGGMHQAARLRWSTPSPDPSLLTDLTPDTRQRTIFELTGPIHGRLMTLRGLCSDEVTYEEIDGMAAEIDDCVHQLVEVLQGVG